jgi:hypothetical protein
MFTKSDVDKIDITDIDYVHGAYRSMKHLKRNQRERERESAQIVYGIWRNPKEMGVILITVQKWVKS